MNRAAERPRPSSLHHDECALEVVMPMIVRARLGAVRLVSPAGPGPGPAAPGRHAVTVTNDYRDVKPGVPGRSAGSEPPAGVGRSLAR